MKEEGFTMILLKIDEGKGLYLKGNEFVSIASIEPDDLVTLIETIAKTEGPIRLDVYNNCDKQIVNPIEETIYEEVFKVLNDLYTHRDDYVAKCAEKLDELEKKYGLEGPSQLDD